MQMLQYDEEISPRRIGILNGDVAIRPRMPAGPSTFTITRERISDQLYAICLLLPLSTYARCFAIEHDNQNPRNSVITKF